MLRVIVTIMADMSAFHGQANAQIDLIRGWDAGWGRIVWPIITELSRVPSPSVSVKIGVSACAGDHRERQQKQFPARCLGIPSELRPGVSGRPIRHSGSSHRWRAIPVVMTDILPQWRDACAEHGFKPYGYGTGFDMDANPHGGQPRPHHSRRSPIVDRILAKSSRRLASRTSC